VTDIHFRSSAEMDAAFRTIINAHSDASLNAPPAHHTPAAVATTTAAEGVVTAVEVAEIAGAHLGAFVEFVALPVAAPLAAMAAGLAEIDHAWEEAARRGTEVDHLQMRGAMLYALGRIPHPDRSEVVDELGTHVRDGARDAARWERTRPEAFAALQDRVRTHFHDGEIAVLDGQDTTPSAERRYERDPIYRMAVDELRALRESDPDAFAARAADAHAMREAVRDARAVAVRA
jgi:hypothetical protein